MNNVALCVITWVVVYPACLVIALYVWRACYQKYLHWKREEDRRAAVARIEEQDRKIRESWGLKD